MTAQLSCCILQPSFIPWLGWFDIVDQVDVCVFLDDVEFSKQSWQQRNRIRTVKGLEFLSIPVRSASRSGQLINEVELAGIGFITSFAGKVKASYADAPHYSRLGEGFSERLVKSSCSGRLVDVNLGMVHWFSDLLQLNTEFVLASDMRINGKRGERVAAICQAVGADRYLSPLGAREYLREDYESFESRSVSVELHQYVHPTYRQMHAPFMPYASSLDVLMMVGPEAMSVVRKGRRKACGLFDDKGVLL